MAIETLFHIADKTGKQVPYKLNPSQRAYDSIRTNRDIITKARQKGFSSLGIAYQVIDCLGKEGTRAVLISHEGKATMRLLDRARYYMEHMNGPKPELGRASRNEFYFPKTESSYYIGTAGAKAFGRGDTITHLHISEYAWWESDALKQVAGLFQAVPKNGIIRIESTGHGRANDFFYMVEKADELGYTVFFRAWWQDPEYQMVVPVGGFQPAGYEHYFQDMQHQYNLTEEQLYWYWVKLLEFRLDLATMQQEYPSKIEECFQASGGAVFPSVTRVETPKWKWKQEFGVRVNYLEGHPIPGHTYVIGGDAAGGTGNDEAATQIFDLNTLEQVKEYGSSHIDPVQFGRNLIVEGLRFNEAYIVAEGNNHGIATHSILKDGYPKMKLYKRLIPTKGGEIKYGYNTGESTKPALIGLIKEAMDFGITLYGDRTIQQMLKYEENSKGQMGGPEDGLVIALGLACVGIFKWMRFVTLPQEPKPKPNLDRNYMFFTWEELFDKAREESKAILPNQLRRG